MDKFGIDYLNLSFDLLRFLKTEERLKSIRISLKILIIVLFDFSKNQGLSTMNLENSIKNLQNFKKNQKITQSFKNSVNF